MNWQPIDTAPSDTVLLLYTPYIHPANTERIQACVYHDTRAGTKHGWATHWMPLPSFPVRRLLMRLATSAEALALTPISSRRSRLSRPCVNGLRGVRDEVLYPLALQDGSKLGEAAEGFGSASVAILAGLEVPYANHPQWVLGFEAGMRGLCARQAASPISP